MPERMTFRERVRRVFLADPVTTRTPGEVAIADTRRWTLRDIVAKQQPYNPDALVQQKGGLRIYDQMREDDQVKACLWITKAAIMGPGWKLDAVGDSEAEWALAETLTGDLARMGYGSLDDALWELLTALDYGFACAEKVYGETEDGEALTITALKGRAPHDLEFNQDAFGNLLSIQQRQGGREVDLDPAKFVYWQNQPEFGNLYGRSLLREAYKPYWFKTNWLQWWAIFGEKLAIPPVYGKHKPAASGVAGVVLQTLSRIQAGTAMTVSDDWELATLETSRDPKAVFEAAIDHHNAAIARACLLFDKSGVSGKGAEGGSYSLAQTQFDTWLMVVGMWRRRLEATLQTQLVDELAEFRAPGVPAPRFQLLPITEDNREALVGAWNALVVSGAVLPELEDENHARRLLRFPERTGEEPPPAAQKAEQATQAARAATEALDAEPAPADDESATMTEEDVATLTARLRAIPLDTVPAHLRATHEALLRACA